MGVADEIQKLDALRTSGALSEDEFVLAKRRLLDGPPAPAPAAAGPNALHRFTRSATDCWAGGVCGGLGQATAVPSWGWRVLFCGLLVGYGFGLLAYFLLWAFVPGPEDADPHAPR